MHIPDHCPLPAGAIVWAYLRDSGGDTQERSVAQQLDVARAYCARHQLILERVFADEAEQGSSAEQRAALADLLAAAEQFPLIHDRARRERAALALRRGVLFWMVARLGRDATETAWLTESLRMRGLAVVSLADPLLTGSPTLDPVLEAVMRMKAELDLQVMSRDIKRGLHAVVGMRDDDPRFLAHHPAYPSTGAYLGIFPNRVVPRGFQAEPVVIGQRRDGRLRTVQRLVPDPVQWPRAQLAWRLRVVDRASYPDIHAATHLYSAPSSYSYFFANRLYAGMFEIGGQVYGSPDDPFVLPLVSLEWFETEAERMAGRAARRRPGGRAHPDEIEPRWRSHGRLLSGLLYCARCGARLWAAATPERKGHRRWPYYWCSGAYAGRCDAGRVGARRLETAILRRLRDDVLTPAHLREHLAYLVDNLAERRQAVLQELRALDERLKTLARQAASLAEAIALRPASPTLLHKLDEVEAGQREARALRDARQSDLAAVASLELDEEAIEALIDRIMAAMGEVGNDNARHVVATFIARIDIEPGKLIAGRIHYTFPLDELTRQGVNKERVKASVVNPWPLIPVDFTLPRGVRSRLR